MSDSQTLKAKRGWRQSVARWYNTRLFDVGDAADRENLWAYVAKQRAFSDATACLQALLSRESNVTEQAVTAYLKELAESQLLRRSLERYRTTIDPAVQPILSNEVIGQHLFCYVATRFVKPKTVIETGCATGWSAALFLLAMHHNQQGQLFSIDLPPVAGRFGMKWSLPAGLEVGFYVPEELRSRWRLITGDARLELIPLLEKVRTVDIFHHDSDHSYVHMMWEYTTVWPSLSNERGLIISDDIGWNTAFWDFATAVGRPFMIHRSNTNFGALYRWGNSGQ